MSELLTSEGKFRCKASSTLNGTFAAKNMFDGSSDTCWNSAQGQNQFILIELSSIAEIKSVRISFQGGFAGQECIIEAGDTPSTLQSIDLWDTIRDSNDPQDREFPTSGRGRYLKLTFPTSTDFYGRIIVYSLEVFGSYEQ